MMEIIHGDCFEVLKSHPDNSIDSVITDPPYGLSFMGKKWDYQVPEVELWKEVLRVLKPGGHALVACGTRTQHRMAVNLEDAGFEIRDIVAWIYGSGFPKSLNVALAIDKQSGAIGNRGKAFVTAGAGNREDIQNTSGAKAGTMNYKNPVTDEAKQWGGWGTALKPAMELWTLCRKPLSENTVAENVLKWGTGGINIDGSRVPVNPEVDDMMRTVERKERVTETWKEGSGFKNENNHVTGVPSNGRFPANIIHDGSEEVVSKFPVTTSGNSDGFKGQHTAKVHGTYANNVINPETVYADTGSAARFFYCAKASKSERNNGCDSLDEKHFQMRPFAEEGWDLSILKNRMNSKSGKNHHPTVKPIALMEYLIKLITPPQGIVLDPFMGSGSTGVAAKKLGFNFIGIEREKEYVDIATARIENEIIPDKQLAIF